MRPVRFLEEAQDEFLEQITFYEERQKGLGDRFRQSVEVATALASAHPDLGSPVEAANAQSLPEGVSVLGRVPS